jgi:hypothetical protein
MPAAGSSAPTTVSYGVCDSRLRRLYFAGEANVASEKGLRGADGASGPTVGFLVGCVGDAGDLVAGNFRVDGRWMSVSVVTFQVVRLPFLFFRLFQVAVNGGLGVGVAQRYKAEASAGRALFIPEKNVTRPMLESTAALTSSESAGPASTMISAKWAPLTNTACSRLLRSGPLSASSKAT